MIKLNINKNEYDTCCGYKFLFIKFVAILLINYLLLKCFLLKERWCFSNRKNVQISEDKKVKHNYYNNLSIHRVIIYFTVSLMILLKG